MIVKTMQVLQTSTRREHVLLLSWVIRGEVI